METFQKYRRKPVVLDACQWWPGLEVDGINRQHPEVIDSTGVRWPAYAVINTLEGPMTVSPGDFVVRGVAGECWAVKPDIFMRTYEKV